MFISRQARMMRMAISPRLAIRIFSNMTGTGAFRCKNRQRRMRLELAMAQSGQQEGRPFKAGES
jgi:hypothetical protein